MDHGAIVIGAGHNGLICAAYLAQAGLDVLVVEARDSVGGCASTVDALEGGRVNICNCEHTMVRATPIAEELNLARHGLRYLAVDPGYFSVHHDGGPGWYVFADLERTLDGLRVAYPSEVENYRRYAAVAVPVVKLALAMANDVPRPGHVLRAAGTLRARGLYTLLNWSRRSAGDVVRSFFTAEQVRSPVITAGPSVWGMAPDTPGTGLGALGYATIHAVERGRPVGGSGALPDAVRGALLAAGGSVQTGARVSEVLIEGRAVRGVRLITGEEITAPIVVSAGDPRQLFVDWLRNAPHSSALGAVVARYAAAPGHDGYESKIDAVIAGPFRFRQAVDAVSAAVGLDPQSGPLGPTTIVSKSLAQLGADHARAQQGRIAARPQFLVNTPSVLDPTLAAGLASGEQILSVEAIWTPYALDGGWAGSREPQRWLDVLADLTEGLEVRRFRTMTPVEYESQFFMTRGYAPSFAGTPFTTLLAKWPEQTRYRTPIEGLFLTGAGTYPGAGVWGASGRNAATAVLSSDGRSGRARRAAAAALAGL